MRRQLLGPPALVLILVLTLAGCDSGLDQQLGVVKAKDLSGTYTGVLQGVTVSSLDDLDYPQRHVIVDIDLLHEVTIRDVGQLKLRIESRIIPPVRAFVVGIAGVAINAEFIEFEELDISDHDTTFEAMKVKQIVFVEYEAEWIAVLQLIRVDVEPRDDFDGVYVYQYVSYPSTVAEQMGEDEAIRWVNMILRLASEAQRM